MVMQTCLDLSPEGEDVKEHVHDLLADVSGRELVGRRHLIVEDAMQHLQQAPGA